MPIQRIRWIRGGTRTSKRRALRESAPQVPSEATPSRERVLPDRSVSRKRRLAGGGLSLPPHLDIDRITVIRHEDLDAHHQLMPKKRKESGSGRTRHAPPKLPRATWGDSPGEEGDETSASCNGLLLHGEEDVKNNRAPSNGLLILATSSQ